MIRKYTVLILILSQCLHCVCLQYVLHINNSKTNTGLTINNMGYATTNLIGYVSAYLFLHTYHYVMYTDSPCLLGAHSLLLGEHLADVHHGVTVAVVQ